tara:strand:+ start:287 stop:517 length:231 start_codon:yes stop_codon:yes gene_type:complete
MADRNPWIEVPVTSQLEESFVIEVTPEVLEETGCKSLEELLDKIQNGDVDVFDLEGDWESGDQQIQSIHYEWSRIC